MWLLFINHHRRVVAFDAEKSPRNCDNIRHLLGTTAVHVQHSHISTSAVLIIDCTLIKRAVLTTAAPVWNYMRCELRQDVVLVWPHFGSWGEKISAMWFRRVNVVFVWPWLVLGGKRYQHKNVVLSIGKICERPKMLNNRYQCKMLERKNICTAILLYHYRWKNWDRGKIRV